MKKFCVTYDVVTNTDVVLEAKTKKEAQQRVLEIIPEAHNFQVWEVKERS